MAEKITKEELVALGKRAIQAGQLQLGSVLGLLSEHVDNREAMHKLMHSTALTIQHHVSHENPGQEHPDKSRVEEEKK